MAQPRIEAKERATFLALSELLTGFTTTTLEGTGQVDVYAQVVREAAGAEIFDALLAAGRTVLRESSESERDHALQVDVWASPVFGPLIKNIVMLWYLGEWEGLPPDWYSVLKTQFRPVPAKGKKGPVSAEAYQEGLAWRVAGTHPPGAKPTGHGGWGLKPVVTDDDIPVPGGGR